MVCLNKNRMYVVERIALTFVDFQSPVNSLLLNLFLAHITYVRLGSLLILNSTAIPVSVYMEMYSLFFLADVDRLLMLCEGIV